jgi:hypothetical protein
VFAVYPVEMDGYRWLDGLDGLDGLWLVWLVFTFAAFDSRAITTAPGLRVWEILNLNRPSTTALMGADVDRQSQWAAHSR